MQKNTKEYILNKMLDLEIIINGIEEEIRDIKQIRRKIQKVLKKIKINL